MLRLPIRILVLSGLAEACFASDSEDVTPNNPFLKSKQRESVSEVAMQLLPNLTMRKGTNYYSITNSNGKVVRFGLFRQAYKLGDDIIGSFDFSNVDVPCVQFSVTLQSEEIIKSSHCRKKPEKTKTVTSYSKFHEFCLHLQQTHMTLPVPLHLTPSFETDMAILQWRLHFEFVTTISPDAHDGKVVLQADSCEDGTSWQGTQNLEIETMIWDLPITIYPTCATQVNYSLQMPAATTVTF